MAAAAVDTAYIALAYSIPEPTVKSLLDEPTTELVSSLLEQLVAKAHHFDALRAEKLRTDIELENVVRTGDSRARALKTTADKGLNEVQELRRELNEKGTQG